MGRFVVFSRCNTSRCGSNVKVVKWHSSSTGSISFVTVKGKKTTMCNSLGGRCTYSSLSSLKKKLLNSSSSFWPLVCYTWQCQTVWFVSDRAPGWVRPSKLFLQSQSICLKNFTMFIVTTRSLLKANTDDPSQKEEEEEKKCCKKPTGGVYKRSGSPPR